MCFQNYTQFALVGFFVCPACRQGLGVLTLAGKHACDPMQIPCHGLDLDFAIQLDAEAEDVLTLLLGQLFAVGVERDLLLVGVDLDLDLVLSAVR